MKSSLVILYHREPYDEVIENGKVHYRPKKSPNGILPTLKSFFASVNQGTWIAWKQVTAKQRSNFETLVTVEGEGNYNVCRIPLSADQVKHFYHITSKEAFWPILHSFPYHFTYESSDWENFHTINRMFAEAACEQAADDALIWIHDYNLWMAPHYIRQLKPNAKIAFFHHTPFPSVDVFNILPWREEIVDSLLCCDIVGFHIPRYSENFVNVARSLRPVEVVEEGPIPEHITPVGTALAEPMMTTYLRYKGQLVNIDAFPVGTNPKHILSVLSQPSAQKRMAEIKEELGDRKLIIAAGRVDYVKGNREKLQAFGRLLERRPDLHGKINFVMTCVTPATGMRVYKKAQSEIEQQVGKINGRFAQLGWTPILLYTQPLSLEELLSYYRVADICWTTPLRDGLNLVAKEYIIAKDKQPGVLVLSEFVGAAVELPEAILTNPYSRDRMDDSIDKALAMPAAESQKAMAKMYDTVTTYDVEYWANHLLQKFKAIQSATNHQAPVS
ncbi:glucosylglycerol-phosphate synthase [Acaryochloris sp. IP29b_bin.148]|uniref:glucosylglycerol-phosphate synthase n=1 Tax=Acaryochloris sp. IP29b_bin.148 TaxID=2969218 RepID=UPI002631EC30|nr:glucosylglycerol-phosphate synthase [Acaryochloris sp. IP29b_bin.148]